MTSCEEALLHLSEVLDNEADTVTATEIRLHLSTCTDCDDFYQVQAMVKKIVFRSCCEETAPQALYESIVVRLRSIDTR